jgi:hypothetical protein
MIAEEEAKWQADLCFLLAFASFFFDLLVNP